MHIIWGFAPTAASRHYERSKAIQAICLLSGLLRASQRRKASQEKQYSYMSCKFCDQKK